MISKIIINNVKGITGEQQLTGADLFIGNNGSGKTAHIEALSLAMLGYVPGKKKDLREIMKDASDNQMIVGLESDSGFSFSREFTRKEKISRTGEKAVSFSQNISVSPEKGEKTQTDAESRIKKELGDFPVMIDFDVFLGLSDSAKRDFMTSFIDSEDGWDADRLKNYLEFSLLTNALAENAFDRYENMQELINEMVNGLDYSDINQAIDELVSTVKDKIRYWNAEFKRSSSATQKMVELKNRIMVSDRNIKQHKEELSDLEHQYGQINAERMKSETEMKRFLNYKNRITEISRNIEEANRILKGNVHAGTFVKHQQERDALEKEKKAVPDISSTLKALAMEKEKVQAKQKDLSEKLMSLVSKISELNSEKKHNQTLITKIKLTQQSGDQRCIISHNIKCDKDFSKALAAFSKKEIQFDDKIKNLSNHRLAIKNEMESLSEELEIIARKADAIRNQYSENLAFNNHQDKKISELEKIHQSQKNEITALERSLKQYENELDNLKNNPVEAPEDPAFLEKQLAGITQNIEEIKQKIMLEEEAKTTLSNQQAVMIDAEKAKIVLENYKFILDVIGPKGLQGELLKSQLSGINGLVNENLKLFGIDHRFYFQTESEKKKEIFQFGWIRDGEKIDFNALSGAEQIILMVSLLTAFIEVKQPKMKLLVIDNIDRVHPKNVEKLLSGLLKLKKKLDNIILSGAIENIKVDGWNIIELEGGLYVGSGDIEQRTA